MTSLLFVFFFNDTATTEIYTLSLHDALPISGIARTAICLTSRRFQGATTWRGRYSGRWSVTSGRQMYKPLGTGFLSHPPRLGRLIFGVWASSSSTRDGTPYWSGSRIVACTKPPAILLAGHTASVTEKRLFGSDRVRKVQWLRIPATNTSTRINHEGI